MQFGKLCRLSCKLQILASSHTFIANGIRLETADTVPLAAWNLFGETLQLYTSGHILSIVLPIRQKKCLPILVEAWSKVGLRGYHSAEKIVERPTMKVSGYPTTSAKRRQLAEKERKRAEKKGKKIERGSEKKMIIERKKDEKMIRYQRLNLGPNIASPL